MVNDLKDFLSKNRIQPEMWAQSKCEWDVMCAIRHDHLAQIQMLSESASLFANLIQKIPGVHSVRWRVKDADHLLAKIVRKRAVGEEKYATISVENYFSIVTDLVGIRALHLFKDDCFKIRESILSIWSPAESPVAYVRQGDPEDLVSRYRENGLDVKVHPAGYRSVHFVISSQPINRRVHAEIQVRTIFEEGWSEIDHKIRYPNFSDNELIGYFLTIFNRMAGSADEMGSFVTWLSDSIQDYQNKISEISRERDANLKSIEKLLSQLKELKQQDVTSKATIDELQDRVRRMKGEVPFVRLFPHQPDEASRISDMRFNAIQGVLEQIERDREKMFGTLMPHIGVKGLPKLPGG